ncbi:MAG: hypothetical protein Q8O88_00895 [bacterium]|nr:hypothetical protein [bacterium]
MTDQYITSERWYGQKLKIKNGFFKGQTATINNTYIEYRLFGNNIRCYLVSFPKIKEWNYFEERYEPRREKFTEEELENIT